MSDSALMTADKLSSYLSIRDPFIRLVDATYVLPGSNYSPAEMHARKRIDTASFFPIDEIADPHSNLPHMLPSPELFAEKVGAMGITEEHHVVVYGQENILMGPARAWWMFRVFGQRQVSVLNVSLKVWEKEIYPIRRNKPVPHEPVEYRPTFNENLIADLQAVEAISASQIVPIFDARPADRFNGNGAEPRPGMPSGHIPGSYNIPAGSLMNPETGGLKPISEYKHMFSAALGGAHKNPITTCGSGITACFLALALYELGIDQARVYDGSWVEWVQHHAPGEKIEPSKTQEVTPNELESESGENMGDQDSTESEAPAFNQYN